MVLALALAGLAVSPSSPIPVAHAGNIISLKPYYPNTTTISSQVTSPAPRYANKYLGGKNYINPADVRTANLWVRWNNTGSDTTFWLHNAGPGNGEPNPECSKDRLKWKGTAPTGLWYQQTAWRCAPNYMSRIDYGGNGIQFLPNTWDDASVCATDPIPGDGFPCSWTASGSTSAYYYEGTNSGNLQLLCTGTMNWRAQIHGYMQYAPGLWGIHWSTVQTTNWTGGFGASTGCGPGEVTNWREDYVFADGIPVWGAGVTTKGLKRHWGGNANGRFNWDIWYDGYEAMPAWTTMPALPVP